MSPDEQPTPTPETLSEAIKTAAPNVARAFGQWQALTIRETVNTLELSYIRQGRKPALRHYRRAADGTIDVHHNGVTKNDIRMTPEDPGTHILTTWLQGALIREASKAAGNPTLAINLIYALSGQQHAIQATLHRTVDRLLESAMGGTTSPNRRHAHSWPKKMPPTVLNAGRDLASAVTGRLLQKHVLDDLKKFASVDSPKGEITPNLYNWMVINRNTLHSMEQSAPGFARYYCHLLLNLTQEPAPVHPGQIIAAVKDDLQMDPQLWKSLCRIRPDTFLSRAGGRPLRQMPLQRGTISTVCAAIDGANQPKAPSTALRVVDTLAEISVHFRTATCDAFNPWQAWTNLLHRFLDPDRPQDEDYLGSLDTLRAIDDAIRDHARTGMPWGPGTWQTLKNRSDRWHTRLRRQGMTHVPDHLKNATWESALPPTTIGQFQFTPVTTARQLQKLGAHMGNCLGTYTTKCMSGQSRVFTITRNGALIAAGEILHDTGAWRAGHIETHHQRQLLPDDRETLALIPSMYHRAEQERLTTQRQTPPTFQTE